MPIDTPSDLREHIALAIQVELSTVPPYLYAMHSIADQGSEAALLIRSIVAEEMLHAALATNLLLAVGGEPRYDTTEWIPTYPGLLPHHTPPLMLGLEPASPAVIRDVFMKIEQPEVHGAPPEADVFETLGQFYHALEIALERLDGGGELFADPQVARQLGDPSFYSPVEYDAEDSGGLLPVTDLASALEAIEIIVHQGEGLSTERWADPQHQELTHYFKLLDIAERRSPLGEVLPVPSNPRVATYPEGIREVAVLFNAVYRYIYLIMHELFSGTGDQGELIGNLYGAMSGILQPLAAHLVTQTFGQGVAAATFEIHEFGPDPAGELLQLSEAVIAAHPELESTSEAFTRLCA